MGLWGGDLAAAAAGSAGFGAYGLEGMNPDRLRGARVFVLPENSPENFETHMVFASQYGIR